jgi:hypothetical protein
VEPIFKEDYVIITCRNCKGLGTHSILSNELPFKEETCPSCLGIGLVRIPVNSIPILDVFDLPDK